MLTMNFSFGTCLYSGNKDRWKNIIEDQLKNHLRDLGVEEGFVKAETRYFTVENEKHLDQEKFESRERDIIQKITRKRNEG